MSCVCAGVRTTLLPRLLDNDTGSWYDFNDSRVTPLSIFGIAKQFEGKENAYMLFYRRVVDKRGAAVSADATPEEGGGGGGAAATVVASAPSSTAKDVLTGAAVVPTGKPAPPPLLKVGFD